MELRIIFKLVVVIAEFPLHSNLSFHFQMTEDANIECH
jgi:hypothetical protein